MNPNVDFYFEKASRWKAEIEKLRMLALGCGLTEELKWGCPCYTSEGRNIVLIHIFKEYCALLFFKGALLKDSKGLLIQQTERVQAARQMRFTGLQQVTRQEPGIKACIRDAIRVEQAGLKVPLKKTPAFPVPDEFKQMLEQMPALKTAFEALTPGRQRGYLLYFAAAKQTKTRQARIEKYLPHIFDGKGLND